MRRSDGVAVPLWRRALSVSALIALIGAALVPLGIAAPAEAATVTISGRVFNDYNHDGNQTAASGSGVSAVLGDPGVSGASVRLYDTTGSLISTQTTDANGDYSFTSATTATTAVRVEFETPTGYESSRAPSGTPTSSSNSSVRFITGTTTGVNYAVERPGDYCQDNPDLCSSIFPWDTTSGLGQGLNDLSDTGLIGFDYPIAQNLTADPPTVKAAGTTTGPIYGIAYDKVTQATFSSSFLHRKSPFLSSLAPNQTGVIFRTSGATTTVWANLNTLFPTQLPGGANPHPVVGTDWLDDVASATLIGKRGLGDLDISTDGRFLYSVGLNDKAVYRLSSITAPAAAADVSRFPVPTPASCASAANVQPFGLGVKGDGTVYVGAVCSGEVGASASLLRYYVWTLSNAGVYTLVLDTPVPNSTISVNKAGGLTDATGATVPTAPRWNAWGWNATWTNADRVLNSTSAAYAAGGQEVHPQPMLSDIKFDGDNLILGVRDRYGDQGLGDEKRFDQEPYAHGQGDLVRVCNVAGSYVIEGGTGCTVTGEWFGNDIPSDGWHESGLGALVAIASEPGVVTTAYDPRSYNPGRINTLFNEMGVTNLQKTDTAATNAHLGAFSASILGSDTSKAWGKTNGMGDLEALCQSAPLEIGNRIWNDTNRDGIQDAGEAGIAGVTVSLYNAAGTAAIVGGTAVTNTAGEYYFTTDAARSGVSGTDNIGPGIAFRTGYTLRIGTTANYSSTGPLYGLRATLANQTVTETFAGRSDTLDSDATLVDTNGATGPGTLGTDIFPVITVDAATMNPGENDHTYDAGFKQPIEVDLALKKEVTGRPQNIGAGSGQVEFTITVYNQGAVSVNPVVVTDYINTAHFDALGATQGVTTSLGAATWSAGANPSITLPAALAPGASATIPITLTVANLGTTSPAALTNRAEISAFDTDNDAATGNSADGQVYDVDSVADATNSNDGTEKDDVTNEARYANTYTGTGAITAALDEDDADIASVPLIAVDLALKKVFKSITNIHVVGDRKVTFDLTVVNQGSVAVSPVVVTDYINTSHFTALSGPQTSAAVFTSPAATASLNWVITGLPGASGTKPAISIPSLAVGQSVTFPIVLDINPTALANPLIYTVLSNTAEISSFDNDNDSTNGSSATGWVFDIDSKADTDGANDSDVTDDDLAGKRLVNTPKSSTVQTTGDLDEDDHDKAEVPLYDLALIKDLAPTETGYVHGPLPDAVDFDITVTNQGLNSNYNIRVQDRPEADMGIVLAPPANVASQSITSSLGNTRTVTYGGTDYWTIDQLLPNESVKFRVKVNAVTEGSSPYVNVAEITAFDNDASTINATPPYVQDVDSTPANNIASEDDQDNAQVITRQLVIGSTLFFDTDKDGDADVRAGAGILVQLLNNAGTVVDSAVTDSGGNYFFDGVNAGTYRVGVPSAQTGAGVNATALSGYVSIPGFSATPSALNTVEAGTNDDGDVATGWLAISVPFDMNWDAHPGSAAIDLANAAAFLGSPIVGPIANLNIDFIFQPVPTYRVGNLVWRDTNNNGVVDGAETGVDGVTVQLYTSASVLVATTTTAGGGHYLFSGLAAGDYYVQIPAAEFTTGGDLAGWRASTGAGIEADPDSNVDNNSNATQASATSLAKTADFTLGSPTDPLDASEPTNETDSDTWTDGNNRSNLSVDLGFYELLRIGSTLFFDTDKDGDADVRAGAGIRVQLLDSTGVTVIASALTDAGGNYFFAGVTPGSYRVGVPTSQPGSGLNGYASIPGFSATPSAVNTVIGGTNDDGDVATGWLARSAAFTMAFGTHGSNDSTDLANAVTYLGTAVPDATANLNIDFIFQPVPTYRVGNLVWRDINNDGVFNGAETGVDGVTVELYTGAGAFVASTTTTGGGLYKFETLPAGDYFIRIPASQFTPVGPLYGLRASTGAGIEADPDSNVDNNSNGTQVTAISAASTGVFTLGSPSDPYDASEPTNETDTDTWTDGNNRSNLSVDLGFYEPLRIGSTLFFDADKDGDADVRAGSGILVQLLDNAGVVIDTALTDAAGNYFFAGVTPGTYQVGVPTAQPGSGLNGYVSVPGFSITPSAVNTLEGGTNDDGAVATGWLARSAQFTMAFGTHGGNAPTDLTNAANYLGTAVPDYTANLNIDFIFQPVPTYRVGDLVWRDLNNNGVVDGLESGVDGVTVELYTSANVLVGTTTTAGGGHYLFSTLGAGDYYVQIPATQFAPGGPLSGWRASTGAGVEADPDTNGNNNSNATQAGVGALAKTADFTLGSLTDPFDASEPIDDSDFGPWVDGDNRSNLSVDLGFYELLRIGSTLFLDTDKDGDADVRAGAGILVQLLDTAGVVIASTVTDPGGNYFFAGVTPGTYQVGVPTTQTGAGVNPAALTGYVSVPAFTITPSAQNTLEGGTNDDGAPATGWLARSAQFVMAFGTHGGNAAIDLTNAATFLSTPVPDLTANLNIDFIFQPKPTYRVGDLVWRDTDNNGVVNGGESGIDGVTVELYTSANVLVGTTTTVPGGHYLFSTLPAGDYYVQIPAAEFTTGGDLIGLRASTGAGVEADPDSDVNNNSNGTQSSPTALTRTGIFTLGSLADPFDATEPTNDSDFGPWVDGDNRSNLSVDLGFYELLRIGSTLFFDTDKNGSADVRAGAGILVQLLDGTGVVIDSAVTDAGGNYFFDEVAPGNYRVGIPVTQTGIGVTPTALTGYISVPGASLAPSALNTLEAGLEDDGAIDLINGWRAISAQFSMSYIGLGSNALIDLSNAVAYLGTPVPDTTANLNIDFIFQPLPTYRVGNLVWRDSNNNGEVDGAEAGVDGVTVELYTSVGTLVASTTTSGGGHYLFDTLPAGTYYVQIPATEFTAGDLLGLRASTGTGVEADPDLDVDNNSNAIQASPTDLAKTGNFTLGSVSDALDASEPTNETDSDTWIDGNNRSNLTVDLGFYEPLRVGSLVWSDNGFNGSTFVLAKDNNGIADAGELGISGVEVELGSDIDDDGVFEPGTDDFAGLIGTTTTNLDGSYLFDDLPAGTYFAAIRNSQLALIGLRSSTPDTNGGFPELADDDDDGIPAAGYFVRSGLIELAYGAEPSTEIGDFGAGDSESLANTLAGKTKADTSSQLFVDFGFSPSPLYRLGNIVWRDLDDDGLLDVGENGLENVTVDLYLDGGLVAGVLDAGDTFLSSDVTDLDGHYLFENLAAGNYIVHIDDQPVVDGWRTAGTPVADPEATAGAGVDNDNNAIVDPVDGWTSGRVVLGGPAGATDHNEPTGEIDSNTGNSAEDLVTRDDRSNQTVDFGFFAGLRLGNQVWLDEGAGGNLANGVFDLDEDGLVGITVQLWLDNGDSVFSAGSDTLVDTTTTDGEGNYLFSELEEGDYFVSVPVAGSPTMVSSPGTVGTGLSDDNLDDGAPVTGYLAVTGLLSLSIGNAYTGELDTTPIGDDLAEVEADAAGHSYRDEDSYLTADLGFTNVPIYRIGNRVWADWNNNGDAEAGEPGIAGVLVQLRDDTGAVISETVTDGGGFYEFTSLIAGDYSIYIPVVQAGPGVDPVALAGFHSASVTTTDADANVDNDDNGVDDEVASTLVGWAAGVVTLGDNVSDEPTDETYRSDDATDDDLGQSVPRIEDDYSNYSVDFGFYAISVGNHVWLDVDDTVNTRDIFDGSTPVPDLPAVGVTVELRNPTTNSVWDTTTTDASGQYLFIGLTDGSEYQVVIPASNFAPGGPLEGWYQTLGYETGYAPLDGRDRGIDGALLADVKSASFTADAGSMPLGENAIDDVVNDSVRPDANNNLFVDFAFSDWTPKYRVGDLVWRDSNNNGLVDGTESGIDGVDVDLYSTATGYLATTTTSGGGQYLFENLEAGDYFVQIPAYEFAAGDLTSLRASTGAGVEADPDSDVDDNSNAIQSTPTSLAYTATFTLGAPLDPFDASEPITDSDFGPWVDGDARSNLSVDLGFYQPLRVGSLVWYDDGADGLGGFTLANDDSGSADIGEGGVYNLTVQLWRDVDHDGLFEPDAGDDDETGFVGNTVTDLDGSYLFSDLVPGDYFVAIPAGQAPLNGWRSSSPDFSLGLPEASDDDDDGTVAPGYAAVTGQVVLDYETEPTTESGDYFTSNSEAKADSMGTPTDSNNSQLFVDFGFSPMPEYRIGNLVWRDYDDDGIADLGEPGLAGITVELYRDNGATVGVLDATDTSAGSTTTDADGRYDFDGLEAGEYLVHIPSQTDLDGWRTAGTPIANADGNVDNDNNGVVDATDGWSTGAVTLGGTPGPADHDEPIAEYDGTTGNVAEDGLARDDRSNLTVDFGFFSGLRLGNQVWLDDGAGANLDNGVFDADENGLTGVAVQLWLDDGDSIFDNSTDTLVLSTSTDAEGNYWFEHLEPGAYFVALPAFTGALSSTGTVGIGLSDDNLDDGAPVTGYVAVSGVLNLSIGGAQTAEEDTSPVLDGWAEDEANLVGTTYRDEDSFLTVDFGITSVPLYRIGNRVWADWNNNGTAEAAEPGIAGVLVQLRDDADGLVAETVTNAAGFYEFTGLVEGDYSIYIPRDQVVDGTLPVGSPSIVTTALAGFLSSTATVTNADNNADNDDNGTDHLVASALVGWSSGLVTLTGTGSEPDDETLRDDDATDDDLGQLSPRIDDDRSNYSVDFGFYSISVGNHLWLDLANDGVYNSGTDLPAVGVTVELRDSATDALVMTTTTDASGLYLFTGVVDDGSYVVVIPSDNFDAGQPLERWYPSNGSTAGFTTDGLDRGLTAANFADVESDAFTVDAGAMPLGENSTADLVNDTVRPDANTNLYLDFSFYQMELGGVVFLDPTNNGHDDADGYFNNVTLLLYTGSGTPFLRANGAQATTQTNASGQYAFGGLPTGTFLVEIPASEFTQELEEYGSSDGNNVAGFAPLADSDDLLADNGNPVTGNLFGGGAVRSSVATLAVDTELVTDRAPSAGVPNRDSNLAVDFGFWMVQAGLELGNQIWFDDDKDGIYDVGTEAHAPAGVIVELHDGVTGALLATTTTNSLGRYLFAGLVAGTYYLELPASNFVSGHPLKGWRATSGPGVSNTPGDGLDLDSNGQVMGLAIRSAVVSLVAQLPTLEVDAFSTVNDDRLSDLTVDFGLVFELDTLAFTGADLEHPLVVAFLLVLIGLLLLLIVRSRRRGGRHRGEPEQA